MTRRKSIKVESGYQHRVHRSKKNRKSSKNYNKIKDHKINKEKIKENETRKVIEELS